MIPKCEPVLLQVQQVFQCSTIRISDVNKRAHHSATMSLFLLSGLSGLSGLPSRCYTIGTDNPFRHLWQEFRIVKLLCELLRTVNFWLGSEKLRELLRTVFFGLSACFISGTIVSLLTVGLCWSVRVKRTRSKTKGASQTHQHWPARSVSFWKWNAVFFNFFCSQNPITALDIV